MSPPWRTVAMKFLDRDRRIDPVCQCIEANQTDDRVREDAEDACVADTTIDGSHHWLKHSLLLVDSVWIQSFRRPA